MIKQHIIHILLSSRAGGTDVSKQKILDDLLTLELMKWVRDFDEK